ncbi:MAG: EAL domain-containing protein, partial [Gemmatimonadaceae bacterium]
MTTSAVEAVTRPIGIGNEMHQKMVQSSRNLFGLATLALVAIAATIGCMYAFHEATSNWVAQSRDFSRLARTAYVITVEREMALVDGGGTKSDAVAVASRTAAQLRMVTDSLTLLTHGSPDRARRTVAIADALMRWVDLTAQAPIQATGIHRELANRKRFDVLRNRLALFVVAEDQRYTERLQRERLLRVITSAAVLLEILALLVVLNGIRSRLLSQATELLAQKESLETQAGELEISNAELARAFEEKEAARALVEVEATEQAALFNAITEVFFVIDRYGMYHKVAPTADETIAQERNELLGRRVQEVLPPPIAALALASISKSLDTRSKVQVEYPLEVNGRTIWYAGTVSPLAEDRVLWVVRDISDTKIAAEAIKESEARFRNLVEHSPQAVALHAEGQFLYANPACATLLGSSDAAKLVGSPLLRFVTRESARTLVDSLRTLALAGVRAPTCECQFQPANGGHPLDIEVTSVPVTYNGRAGVLSILHDVTERKELEKQLAHQAFHDPLTNLANRVLFRDRVEHALQRAAGGSAASSVLFIDLDNFKAVNDGLGHSAGDWLLIEVAARLTACLRPADTIARLGGDEFAVLIDDETAPAEATAEVILQAFREPFAVQGTDIVVTMSIGIAAMLPRQDADEVLRNADLALYRAKGEGKGCAASFEPSMHVAALRRLEIETELRRAINGEPGAGSLVLYYQPIARLATGRMSGFEALVRWEHPERGTLQPMDFISLAEETGLIVPLGRWVIGEACRQTREWQLKFGPLLRGTEMGLTTWINLSGRHLAQREIVEDVSNALRRSGLAPAQLVLEMTESMLVHDNRATLERLDSLKSLGVQLSIDDFGTGYSSLAYLERFPVDSLKMDRSFIATLDDSRSKSPLVEAVIGLGRILGLRVVAEGIETKLQW